MSDDEIIEQLELENKVLQENNKGLKAKRDELQKELEQEKEKNKKLNLENQALFESINCNNKYCKNKFMTYKKGYKENGNSN